MLMLISRTPGKCSWCWIHDMMDQSDWCSLMISSRSTFWSRGSYHRVSSHQVFRVFWWIEWIVPLLMETLMKIGQLIACLPSCFSFARSWSVDALLQGHLVQILLSFLSGETDLLQGPVHPGVWLEDHPVRQPQDHQAKHHISEVQLPQSGTIKLVVWAAEAGMQVR